MPTLPPDQARRLAGLVAAARCALGVVALAAPGLPLDPWVGADADRPASRLLARALGGRDLALGAGALHAAASGAALRPWVVAGGLADAGDLVATLLHWRSLPNGGGRFLVLVAAGGALGTALVVAPALDRPPAR